MTALRGEAVSYERGTPVRQGTISTATTKAKGKASEEMRVRVKDVLAVASRVLRFTGGGRGQGTGLRVLASL